MGLVLNRGLFEALTSQLRGKTCTGPLVQQIYHSATQYGKNKDQLPRGKNLQKYFHEILKVINVLYFVPILVRVSTVTTVVNQHFKTCASGVRTNYNKYYTLQYGSDEDF